MRWQYPINRSSTECSCAETTSRHEGYATRAGWVDGLGRHFTTRTIIAAANLNYVVYLLTRCRNMRGYSHHRKQKCNPNHTRGPKGERKICLLTQHVCCLRGKRRLARLLLQIGADPTTVTGKFDGDSVLLKAAATGTICGILGIQRQATQREDHSKTENLMPPYGTDSGLLPIHLSCYG